MKCVDIITVQIGLRIYYVVSEKTWCQQASGHTSGFFCRAGNGSVLAELLSDIRMKNWQ